MNNSILKIGWTILLFTTTTIVSGQKNEKTEKVLYSVEKTIQLTIDIDEERGFYPKYNKEETSVEQVFSIDSIYFDDADLVLLCKKDLVWARKLNFEFNVVFNQERRAFPIDQKTIISDRGNKEFEVRLYDLSEKGIFRGENYEIRFHVILRSKLSPTVAPSFDLKLKPVVYGSIAAGTGTFLISELVLRKQQEELYDQYINNWENEAQNDGGLYNRVVEIKNNRQTLRTISILSIGGGLIIMGAQAVDHLMDKQLFKTYGDSTENAIRFRPSLDFNPGYTFVGFQLRYEF